MATQKKERGRPGRQYPSRIDANPEKIAQEFPRTPPSEINLTAVYHCAVCERAVCYPDTLYQGEGCAACCWVVWLESSIIP